MIEDDILEVPQIAEPQEANFATVGALFEDGVTLIFDGMEAATEKHYRCNMSAQIEAGDRVKIIKDSGTYVVEYAVGAPNARVGGGGGGSSEVEYAATAGYATRAGTADSATNATNATKATNATNATNATEATRAVGLCNGGNAGNTTVIQFQCPSSKTLKFRLGYGSWVTLK